MKLPSLQFYPGDWRKDPGVQALSYHDRGVWFEILLLMFESSERGKLLLNGRPMPDDALARLLGLDKQILTNTLTKLLEFGVASRDADSTALICRRMVRDEEIRKVRAECGKLGGNPDLLKQKSKQKTTTQVKQKSTPSSSSSISSSEEPPNPQGGKEWRPDDLQKRINGWYHRRDNTPWSEKELRAYKKLPPTSDDELDLLERYTTKHEHARRDIPTLLNNWQGDIDRARRWADNPRGKEQTKEFTML